MPIFGSAVETAGAYLAARERLDALSNKAESTESMMVAQTVAQQGIVCACLLGCHGLLLRLKVRRRPELVPLELQHELTSSYDIARVILGLPVGDDELWNDFG